MKKIFLLVKAILLVAVVNSSGALIGIMTRYDVLEQFQSAFGMRKKGVRIAFATAETEGRIAVLADIVKQIHQNIISIATFDETDKLVQRIGLKLEKNDEKLTKLIKRLEDSGFRILSINED